MVRPASVRDSEIRARPPRRSHAERRAATRAAITAAALDALAELGYTAMTFADVAARAGVSRGALLHYFPQKSDLALGAIEDGLSAEMDNLRDLVNAARNSPRSDEGILDAILSVYYGNVYQAYLAVNVHARTDPDLHARLNAQVEEANRAIQRVAAAGWRFDPVDSPGLSALVRLITATVQGIALMGPLEATGDVHQDETWALARAGFVKSLRALRRSLASG